MALTPKQQRFVEELLADQNRNATAAYRRAYPRCRSDETAGACAARLLGSARVQAAIRTADAARAAKLKIDAEWVLRRLVRNAKRAAQAVPVRDREGNSTGEYAYQGAVVNKALELIGKHVGMFGEMKVKVDVSGGVECTHTGKVDHEHTADPDQLAAVIGILEEVGAFQAGGVGAAPAAEDDEVHPRRAKSKAAGVPPAPPA